MPRKIENWRSTPVESEIIHTVIRNQGEILTTDLLRYLSTLYDNFTKEEMMDILFRMEVRSYIQVVQIKKDVSKVELGRNPRLSDDLMAKVRAFRH